LILSIIAIIFSSVRIAVVETHPVFAEDYNTKSNLILYLIIYIIDAVVCMTYLLAGILIQRGLKNNVSIISYVVSI